MQKLRAWAHSKAAQAVALGLASALLVLGAERLGWLETAERKALDWRFRTFAEPGRADPEIVIVAIDDSTFASRDMREMFGRWPFRRQIYAALVHFLNEWGARVIGIDLMFVGADPHAGDDDLLAQALAERPSVVLAFTLNRAVFREKDPAADEAVAGQLAPFSLRLPKPLRLEFEEYSGVDLSQPEFVGAVPAMGSITVESDSDGPLRAVTPVFHYRGAYYLSFALAIAALAEGGKPEVSLEPGAALGFAGRRVPVDAKGRALLRWHGPAYTYKHYSAWRVLNAAVAYEDGETSDLDPEIFRNKIVLLGATAAGAADLLSNPFSSVYPGVEVHATAVDNLLKGEFVRTASPRARAAAVAGLALAMAGLVYLFGSAVVSALLATLLGGAWFAAASLAFRSQDLWLPLVAPLAAGIVAFTGATLTRYATEGREKRRYRRTLVKYLSPQLVETIMQDFNWESLRAEKRYLTVLFSDVRGFTTITEQYPPEVVVETLNEMLNMMVSVIFKHQGTLDKFVGDCVMAFWGAPLAQANQAELACRAGLDMVAGLEKLNEKWQSEGRPGLKVGVGINTGDMLFGNIGSEQRMDFTVIGDAVNLGARLESATRELKATIVISEATCREVGERAEVRPLGEISVKGKTQKIVVYELLGLKGSAPAKE